MTPHSLIVSLGGYRELAAAVGKSPSRVWRWMDEGIPSRSWTAVVEFAGRKGVPLTLADLAAQRPAPREKMRRGPRPTAPAMQGAA